MNKIEIKPNSHYWIKTEGITTEHKVISTNPKGLWMVPIFDKTVFLSNYKLELLFGRNCIIREVDFTKDVAYINKDDVSDETLKNIREMKTIQINEKTDDGKTTILDYDINNQCYIFSYTTLYKKRKDAFKKGILIFNV